MEQIDKIVRAYQQNMFSRGDNTQDVLALYKALPEKDLIGDNSKNLYHVAATYADYEAIELLATEGVKPRPDDRGNTPLHDLVNGPLTNSIDNFKKKEESIYRTVQKLLELKVNPKKKNDAGQIAYYEAGLKTMYPFIQALADGSVKMDAVGEENKNLLHAICSRLYHRKDINGVVEASYKTIKSLLDAGLDPEDKDMFDTTPLTYAQRSEVKKIAALLSGDDTALKTGGMSLEQAVLQKDTEAIEALIQSGADINEWSENRRTPLMIACEYPSLDIVQLLLKHGADCNSKSGEDGRTAVYYLLRHAVSNLSIGVRGGQQPNVVTKIMRSLVDSKLDVDGVVDNNGNTAINLLCSMNYLAGLNNSLAEELIGADCDLNLPNLMGKTPLMTFAEQGDEPEHNLVELLLDNDAKTDLVDKNSCTALMYAAGNRNKMSAKKMVELILEAAETDIERTNNLGESALDIAVRAENEAVVKLLLNKM